MIHMTLWVFFEEPFWVGVFERIEENRLTAARVVFGAEPSDREVYGWVLAHAGELRFSPAVESAGAQKLAANPKRRQREAARVVARQPGTRAQQAISIARELGKTQRAAQSREQRDARQEHKRQLRAEKKKARHKGH